SLDTAQEAKLDLICRKLGLRPGQRVLDIGCGWGEALKFAAERYGVSGVGITISQEQADYARELCAGLPIEIRLQDYHEVDETFDAILS
ncbi:class I SAM-dependent methyltransferase, partial [Escherichia coli]|uniref:class I SAM-dependent methyltransferase n=1 Tax=Escherichia coli TaxID=562 RepID=UPI001ED9CC3E